MEKDLYEVLGVERSASQSEIKKAYKRLAMKLHPDRNPGKDTQSEFKQVQRAYDVLSDDQKRSTYDQFGHDGVNASAAGGGYQSGYNDFGDAFSDIFSDFFGGGRQRSSRRAQRGADLQYDLDLTLEEAFHGKEVKIRIPVTSTCDVCQGTGAKKGSKPQTCKTCNGVGQVRIQQGFINIQQTCPTCRGRGTIITDPCSACNGSGFQTENKTIAVKIPAGIEEGNRIRLEGKGEAGANGQPAGDLYVSINIKQHAIFERHGVDLLCDTPIDFVTAALGGELDVPTLKGRLKLKIPAGTQTGKTFRLKGKGITSIQRGQQGDLYCRIMVETPVNLSRDQKQMLEALQKSLGGKTKHNPQQKSWLDSLKNFFDLSGR